MAALGKIRQRGITLIIIIGLGLFAFIAEEAFRSCSGIKGEAKQQVGEILGEKSIKMLLSSQCNVITYLKMSSIK